jgi:hypothetical protein
MRRKRKEREKEVKDKGSKDGRERKKFKDTDSVPGKA